MVMNQLLNWSMWGFSSYW